MNVTNSVIANYVRKKLDELHITSDTLVVLKGLPLSIVDSSITKINLSDVVSNKLGYFISLYGRRNCLSYEEFLLLSDFIVSQYKEIYILNNNIYIEQYPIEEYFDDNIRRGLLNHYEESEEDETDNSYIGDIDEYISIFQGLKEYNCSLVGVYSSVAALQSSKVITINLFDNSYDDLMFCTEHPDECIEIIEEADYINMVKLLSTGSDKIYVRISNYTGDVNKLKNHIAMISHYWKDYIVVFILQVQEPDDEYVHRECTVVSCVNIGDILHSENFPFMI